MDSFTAQIGLSLWFGILTSISPCPMATNIAAISFISKQSSKKGASILSGLAYSLGRTIAYVLVAYLIISGLFSTPELARFLIKYLNYAMGPILILTGLIISEIIKIKFNAGSGFIANISQKLGNKGLLGAFLLGFIFALSFCPVSAGLFFGSLIPLALKSDSAIFIPSFYGLGTAIPVIIFSIALSFSLDLVSKLFNNISRFDYWTRRITGIIFILAGIYISYRYWLT